MLKLWQKLAETNKIDYHMALSVQIILKRIMFILGYFMLSKLALNFISKRIFKSELDFRWNIFEME